MQSNLAWAARPAALMACAALAGSALAACGSNGEKAGSGKSSGKTLAVTLTDKGCAPTRLTAPAGAITFAVANGGSAAVTEMELKDAEGIILGERENVAAGLHGSFTLNVKPGRYAMNCPNGKEEDNGVLTVTGATSGTSSANAPARAAVAKAVAGYRKYVGQEAKQLLQGTSEFVTALRKGEVKRAKELFGPVRRHYEAIEPVAESFGDLDPRIDARVNDVPSIKQWTGFHRIEEILWVHDTTRGTKPYGKLLLADVGSLLRKICTFKLQAPQLANGAVELLNEVANSKITGEEDRYSHTDLSDFEGNLTGARVAFEQLRGALQIHGDNALASEIAARFSAVQTGLDRYRRNTPLGFAYYSQLTPTDRRRFAQQVDALAEPLSTVAARVAG